MKDVLYGQYYINQEQYNDSILYLEKAIKMMQYGIQSMYLLESYTYLTYAKIMSNILIDSDTLAQLIDSDNYIHVNVNYYLYLIFETNHI